MRPGAAVAAALVATACTTAPPYNGPCDVFSPTRGDVCGEQLYFPTGVATDPRGDMLYVTNANADLRYAGGVVQAIDLRAFACMRALQRGGVPPWPLPVAPEGCTALGAERTQRLACAMQYARDGFAGVPAGCDAAWFDARRLTNAANQARVGSSGLCRPDLLDPAIVECDEQLLIEGALGAGSAGAMAAVRVGNFAGAVRVRVQPAPGGVCAGTAFEASGPGSLALCDDGRRRLYLTVRGDPSITWIAVDRRDEGGRLLDCGADGEGGALPSCGAQRITVRDFHSPLEPGAACSISTADDPTRCVRIPSDPFGLALDQGRCNEGDCVVDGGVYERLLVSHLLGGEVMLIDAANPRPISTPESFPGPVVDGQASRAVVLDARGGLLPADGASRRGAYAVAPRTPGVALGYWYVTSRTTPVLANFRIVDVNLIQLVSNVSVAGGPFASGDDIRDLAFDPCTADNPGCRAFLIQNRPASLFTLDTRIDPQRVPAGLPRNVVIDIVSLCQEPSHLGFRGAAAWRPTGAGPRNRVYVLCYGSNQMAVVDPDRGALIDLVLVGRGPNELAFNFGTGLRPLPAGRAPEAYVTNFLDNSISVVDLQPGSPTENRVVARIGFTEPPRLQ